MSKKICDIESAAGELARKGDSAKAAYSFDLAAKYYSKAAELLDLINDSNANNMHHLAALAKRGVF
jgi:hypothetical protein